jgi:tRNA(Ile)-lysidine synthase
VSAEASGEGGPLIARILLRLVSNVQRFAATHDLWRRDTRVIAAVSGGSDSVALFLLLNELQARGALQLIAVAHLNHMIRGDEADADEAWCRTLASTRGVAFVSAREDVPALARRDKTSLEVAARRARQRFFEEVRQGQPADRIATAHTADDQAETVLLHLVRGSGARGFGAMAPRRRALVRPLLECTRDELRQFLTTAGQTWREDATNRDVSYPRNRIRHELLPYIAAHFNPRIGSALARFADLARADADVLDRDATAAAVDMVHRTDGQAAIDATRLNALPDAVARRVVRNALRTLRPGEATLTDIERIRAVASGLRRQAELSGVRVEHSGGFVVLVSSGGGSRGAATRDLRQPAPFRFDLPVPGSVEWPPGGWALDAEGPITRSALNGALGESLETARGKRDQWLGGPSNQVAIDAAGVGPAVVVRRRQSGDWIRPLGLGGRKKLQDVLVDRKVPRERRDLVPVVTDVRGRVIWVAGHVLAEEFRVTSDTNAVVILKLRRI